MMMNFLLVATGGAIGASARFAVNLTASRLFGNGFPFGTLGVNILGSFLMGLLVVFLGERGGIPLAAFLMTGVLGGFTTFSAFSIDTLMLVNRGQGGLALIYVAASVGVSLFATFVGLVIGRSIFA